MKHLQLIKIVFAIIIVFALVSCKGKQPEHSVNHQKQVVEKYMDGLRSTDRAKILSCVSDDVVWEMPGIFYCEGKAAFDKELENPDADGYPDISITQLVEEGNIVVVEGNVKTKMKDGNTVNAVFCNVFHLKNDTINKLTSYVVFNKDSTVKN